jgi:hypothetical protein
MIPSAAGCIAQKRVGHHRWIGNSTAPRDLARKNLDRRFGNLPPPINGRGRPKAGCARSASVDHTMRLETQGRLENQGLSPKALQAEREHLAAELLRRNIRGLWDEPK